MGTAQQLLSGFSRSDVYSRRPRHDGVTCRDIVLYMLREEAIVTSNNGAYSGLDFTTVNLMGVLLSSSLGPLQVNLYQGF